MLWSIFAGIVMMALGILLFCKPAFFWSITEQWKSYDATEPSDLYLLNAKIGGAAFALVGAAAIVLPFFIR